MKRKHAAAIFICSILLAGFLHGEDLLRIGVLANQGKVACLEKWSDTADYLSESIEDKAFTIIPLNFEEVFSAAANHEVDFFLVNSAMYIELEVYHGADRIATLSNQGPNNIPYSVFGGVILFRRDQHPNATWKDLESSRIAAVNPSSFGGWLAPLREMKHADLNTRKIYEQTEFLNRQDAVVLAVRDGWADAGIVKTDVLERMEATQEIRLEDFTILPLLENIEEPRQNFSFLHSTRLYPEWAIARAEDVPDELAKRVGIALLKMPPDSQAAVSAKCTGWILPVQYNSVRECLRELRVRPYQSFETSSFSDKFKEYGLIFLVILTVMIAVVWILLLKRLVTWRIDKEPGTRADAPAAPQGFTNLISITGPWILIGLVSICILGNYILRNHIVLPQFEAMETREARRQVTDCVQAIHREIDHLEAICRDWAFWNDTYAYMENKNPDYIESNLTWPVLHNSGIDMVLLCNLEGTVVWGEIHHPAQDEPVELEAFSVKRFSPDNPLIQSSWPPDQEENSGLYATEKDPIMVASIPIQTSNGEGPSRGTLIFGKFLDDKLLDIISDQFQVNCELISIDDKQEDAIVSRLSPGTQIIDFPDDHHLVGYGLLNGIRGKPELVVKVQSPRHIMHRGLKIAGLISLTMFSAVVLISVGLFVWFSFLMVESVRRRRLIEQLVDQRTAELRKHEEELKLANENLKMQSEYAFKMAEAADEANEIKSTFISNLGHEIRTPMQAVLGFVELILKTDLSSKQSEYLNKIHSSTKSLSAIVKDIFDFSRIEMGQVKIQSIPFSLNEVSRELLDIFGPAASLKGLKLDIDFSIGTRRMLLGDPVRLRQIMGNLLANAVKFTQAGHITANATLKELTEDSVHLLFTVSDTGIGISEEKVEKIFIAFKQVDGSKSRRYGGIGIGLAVAERLAALMDTTIHVESKLGKGSVFSFSAHFPLSEKESDLAVDVSEEPVPDSEKPVVDVVDIDVAEESIPILMELAVQLDEGDSAAIHLLKKLDSEDALPGAQQLLKFVKQYDFEGALELLHQITQKAGIDLKSSSGQTS